MKSQKGLPSVEYPQAQATFSPYSLYESPKVPD